jgi:glycosyltransferase involved in cell wall biosynthesis
MNKPAKELFTLFFSKDETIKRFGRKVSPRISVVTPIRNTGQILQQTARCLQRQTFRHFEWILVDDASNCLETQCALAEIAKNDARVRVITLRRWSGIATARNLGARSAVSDLLFFLDGDDLLESTALEKCYLAYLANPQVNAVTAYNGAFGGQSYLWNLSETKLNNLQKENPFVSVLLIERELFEKVGGFDQSKRTRKGGEDWILWARLFENKTFRLHIIPEYLFWYRRVTPSKMRKKWPGFKSVRNIVQGQLIKEGPISIPCEKTSLQADLSGYPEAAHSKPRDMPHAGSKKKRIVLLMPYMQIGGADAFNLNLIRELQHKHWEVTVVTTLRDSHPWFAEFYKLTQRVYHIANLAGPKYYWPVMRLIMREVRPNVLFISNSAVGYHLLPSLRIEFPKTICVDYNHMEEISWENGGHALSGVYWQEYLDISFVASNHLKNWMVSKSAQSDRIKTCYIGTDISKAVDCADKPSTNTRASSGKGSIPFIIFPARLVAQKQPLVFLQALRLVKARNANFTAAICGDGPLETTVKKTIMKYGLQSHVRMLGSLSNDDVHALYECGDILFLPSANEGISLAIYEAMSHGMVVVGADVGGQKELVRPGAGFLVKRSSPEIEAQEYAEIICSLIANPKKRYEIGKRARRRIIQGFTTAKMGRRMNDILTSAISNKRPQRRAMTAKQLEVVTNRLVHLVVRSNAQ